MNAYRRTLGELYALDAARGIDLKLDRVRHALDLLGSPERRYATVHIAGTNGKGSTAAMLDAVLQRAGYRVGLYTSPHLVDFTERIRIDGQLLAEDEVVDRVPMLRALLSRDGVDLTFFELVTVLAFDAFARHAVEIAVLEVGLGGRLDATNVTRPLATAVTGIDYDHEEYLGTTLAGIAAEKAGIMKPGVPVVIGAVDREIGERLLAHAAAAGAPADLVGRDVVVVERDLWFDIVTPTRRWSDLRLGLAGRFQRRNAAVVVTVLERMAASYPVDEGALRSGLATVRWPGRFERVLDSPLVVLDGAHNPAGAKTLRAEMEPLLHGRRVRLVFGVMRDKSWRDMWAALQPIVGEVVVTAPELPRALETDVLAAHLAADVPVRAVCAPCEAMACALDGAGPKDAILVTGSLFLVGGVYPWVLQRQGRRQVFETPKSAA
jgi:dihydrofolate synthase/folylpolyglutamate synthase